MSITKDQILETLAAMTVMDVVELTKSMEEKFNVSAAVAVAAPAAATEAVEVKEEFTVRLKDAQPADKKIGVIKVVRALTSLNLKEAKELVESKGATVVENVDKTRADEIAKMLTEVGAEFEIV